MSRITLPRLRYALLSGLVVLLAAGAVGWSTTGGEAAETTSLRTNAESVGLRIGSAVNATALTELPGYATRLGAEFSSVTTEDALKWSRVEPEPGRYDWSGADAIVDFAAAHDQQVRGHTLVWHGGLPGWLANGTFSADVPTEELMARGDRYDRSIPLLDRIMRSTLFKRIDQWRSNARPDHRVGPTVGGGRGPGSVATGEAARPGETPG